MQYTISEIENGIAKVTWADGSWIFVELSSDMTEADLDDKIFREAPPQVRTGSTPSFVSAGATRTAAEKPEEEPKEDPTPAWAIARLAAYGAPEAQLEYITENGLEAWQANVAKIKADNPKT